MFTIVKTESEPIFLPKTSPTLLIHFCSWSYSINCHEENLPWFNNAEQYLQIVKNIGKNLIFWDSEVDIVIIWMWTLMYNAIHVQVQVVKFWNLQMPQLAPPGECSHCPRHTWEHSGNELEWEHLCGTSCTPTGRVRVSGFAFTCNLLLWFSSVSQVSWTDSYFILAVSGTSGLLSLCSDYLLHCKMEKQTKTTVFRKIFSSFL